MVTVLTLHEPPPSPSVKPHKSSKIEHYRSEWETCLCLKCRNPGWDLLEMMYIILFYLFDVFFFDEGNRADMKSGDTNKIID